MLFNFLSLLFSRLAVAKILYVGVNEAGGEFGAFGAVGTGLPGTFGVDYAFINQTTIDIFVDQEKVNLFRVPFLMERMCPLATGLGSTFNETYFSAYADAINYITQTKGAYAIIDPHNYMRYNDPSQQPNSGSVIGNTSDPNAATTQQFGEFWEELAGRFANNTNVIFGIQNEPHDLPTDLLLQNNQVAINAIRTVGGEQLILAPGNGFTGGHSWLQKTGAAQNAPSSDFLNMLVDPANNTAIDVHEYLDQNFSGQNANCTQPGPSNLQGLTTWLQQNNLKALLSEFGGGPNTGCFNLIDDLLTFLSENDVYIGWSIWAAGPLWGTSAACCGADTGSLEPGQLNDQGQPNAFSSVWANAVRPNIPTDLRREGLSSLPTAAEEASGNNIPGRPNDSSTLSLHDRIPFARVFKMLRVLFSGM